MPIPGVSMYPKVFQVASRRDTWPTDSGYPDGDFEFSIKQLLDSWAIDYAVLNPLVGISSVHNINLANTLMPTTNEWLRIFGWTRIRDRRIGRRQYR